MARLSTNRRKRTGFKQGYTVESWDAICRAGQRNGRVPFPLAIKDHVYEVFGRKCARGGSSKNLHIDHIIPLDGGGSNESSNLKLLCLKCNTVKGHRFCG